MTTERCVRKRHGALSTALRSSGFIASTPSVRPLVAKHFLPLLARDRKSVFAALSARVGNISDNRLGGWHAYRASKAALNMLLRTLSIELARANPRAMYVGLHPGTVDTTLSAPFQATVPEGKLFTPEFAAARLLEVLDRLEPVDSGNVIAWDGQQIPA
jgi:NAD(P)-dependent dehydrogenase (short-subunit alcohol dehydrogenase family)